MFTVNSHDGREFPALKCVVEGYAVLCHRPDMIVDSSVGAQYTGHGNVVLRCFDGGPGRAGGKGLAGCAHCCFTTGDLLFF